MTKKIYNICFSCAGGTYIIQNILAMRKISDISFKIFGIDQSKISKTNLDFIDKFEVCPSAKNNKNKYLDFISKFCLNNNIDIFFPLSEIEIDILKCINIKRFKTIFILPDRNFVKIASDKFKFLKTLKDFGIIHENFFSINSVDEFEYLLASNKLNFGKIVCKPRVSSGSRGVLVIDNKINFYEPVPDRYCAVGNKKSIFKYIQRNKLDLKNYLVTEYFGNDVYDVDSYIVEGKVQYLVCRQRQYVNPFSPINEGCKIRINKEIEKLVKKVALKLNITGILDLDVAIDIKGKPHIIDVSSRISGSVACGIVANLNIFEVIINHVLFNKLLVQKVKRDYVVRPVNMYCELI